MRLGWKGVLRTNPCPVCTPTQLLALPIPGFMSKLHARRRSQPTLVLLPLQPQPSRHAPLCPLCRECPADPLHPPHTEGHVLLFTPWPPHSPS